MLHVCARVASPSHCVRQRKRWAIYAHLHKPRRHSRKYHSSLKQESNNGSEATQSEMKQGQSLQLLFDGSTRGDQKAINCQRPIHSLSISQLQTRKGSDCTMGSKELLLSLMHGALAAMKAYDLECVSMDCQWHEACSPDCQKCLPVLIAPGVDEIALFVLASCQ